MNRSETKTVSTPPITDSPWLWVLVYTSVPLVTLTLVSHKYGERQAKIEWRDQVAARSGADQEPEDAPQPPAQTSYSSPENTRIPMMPLTALLWVIECAAAVMLTRERRKLALDRRESTTTMEGIAAP
jgi:hypothetical protein